MEKLSETWVTVPDWPAYEVNRCGQLRHIATQEYGKVRWRGRPGQLVVEVRNKYGGREEIVVAITVLKSFGVRKPKFGKVRYLDGNSGNVSLDNLEWNVPTGLRYQLAKTRRENVKERMTR